MTTGSSFKDERVISLGLPHGYRRYKYWDGGNAVPKPPKPKRPKEYILAKKMNKFGTWSYYKVRVRPFRVPTPRTNTNRSLPPNDYGLYTEDYFDIPVTLVDGRILTNYEIGMIFNITLGTLSPNTYNDCVNKLREKILGSDFHAGIVAAEATKTASLLVSTATKLSLAMRQVKRLRIGDAAATLTGYRPDPKSLPGIERRAARQSVAQNWLELQYGWLPLLNDMSTGFAALVHAHERSSVMSFRVRKAASTGTPRGPYPDPASSNASCSTADPGCLVAHYSSFERVQIIATLNSYDYSSLAGFTDPLSIAWELVPYSFVVDWFIPIGNYFQSLATARSLTGKFVTTTTRKCDAKGYIVPYTGSALIPATYDVRRMQLHMIRSVSNSLEARLPAVKPIAKIASVGHALNALALVFGRKFNP